MIRSRRFLLALATAAAFLVSSRPLDAADGTTTSVAARALREQLARPASVIWDESPLRRCLDEFSRAQRVAVLLDRRVDPDQKLDLEAREQPILAILQAVAEDRGLRASVLGGVVYLGPPTAAERLRTVAELRRREIESLPAELSRRFAQQSPLAWRDLASPRDLVGQVARQGGFEIVNLDRVPHDLWAAGSLPALSLADRLTLILHQFDLTFQVAEDAPRLALTPVPDRVALVNDYPAGSAPEALMEQWRAALPRCEFRLAGDRVYVRGLAEELERIDEMRAGGPKRPRSAGPAAGRPAEQVFTAEVPNRPLGAVLDHFAG
ncbi:MAG: hypothetical protein ACYC6Y_25865, partial [Thermoguttaceae bacterium]